MEVRANSKQSKNLFLHPSSFKFMEEDFALMLKLSETEQEEEEVEKENLGKKESLNEEELLVEEEEENDEDEEDDFSFCFSATGEGSPISADDVFQNGQIRPVFPLFNGDLLLASSSGDAPLKKLFFEENVFSVSSSAANTTEQNEPEGPYCEWKKDVNNKTSLGLCKKSNSTGFSKLWRLKDFVHLRSSSDGKDAFIFLNNNNNSSSSSKNHNNNDNDNTLKAAKNDNVGKKLEKVEKVKVVKKKKPKSETTSLAAHYERNYGAVKAGDTKRRSSYLPYRVGFFTNVNGLSRNIHPF